MMSSNQKRASLLHHDDNENERGKGKQWQYDNVVSYYQGPTVGKVNVFHAHVLVCHYLS
jgi:hypothetical protein